MGWEEVGGTTSWMLTSVQALVTTVAAGSHLRPTPPGRTCHLRSLWGNDWKVPYCLHMAKADSHKVWLGKALHIVFEDCFKEV